MRKSKIRLLMAIIGVSLSTMMCTLNFDAGDDNSSIIAQQVQETVDAMTMATMVQLTLQQPVERVQPTQDVSLQPLPPVTGSITGKLSYPSEMVPPLRIVAFRVIQGQQTGEYYYVDTSLGESQYSLADLPTGFYWVVAYVIKDQGQTPGLAGGYTQAVPCGLNVNCTDHSLIAVEVRTGQVSSADPADWYSPQASFPANPVP